MLGENWLIFALDPNLQLDAETLVFHSGPKFMCFLVDFYKYFWFWCETEIVSKKVYAMIWPVLEITSLNFSAFASFPVHVLLCLEVHWEWRKFNVVEANFFFQSFAHFRQGFKW